MTYVRLAVAAALLGIAPHAWAMDMVETPYLRDKVQSGDLPPVHERLPENPRVVTFDFEDQEIGKHGGEISTLMRRAKDTRMMTVYGYARLVKYTRELEMIPDMLESYEVEDGRIFTFKLRKGHKWSDGTPFTTEDFRYWWEDVANHEKLFPVGPPAALKVSGEYPKVEVIDETTIRYSWSNPHPSFLHRLAGASPLYIYAPAHYLKQFHADYVEPAELKARLKERRQRNWAAFHNRSDDLYRNNNPELPTLQPWVVKNSPPSERFIFERNPFYHKVDAKGQQLPYVDRVLVNIAESKLIPGKTATGEVDLQARYLRFDDYTLLKKNEEKYDFNVRLWRIAKGAHLALFPNLTNVDPTWRALLRDIRFRHALSYAVDREEINEVIYFGLGVEGNNTMLPESPLYREEYRSQHAQFDLDRANELLDEIGLTERNQDDIRMMPNGQPLEIIVETAGKQPEEPDVLQLIHDTWMEVGVKLHIKPSSLEVVRNRVFAGDTVMSIFSGIENGLATPTMTPEDLAPVHQIHYQWPKWGQYIETFGKSGEPADMPEAREALDLYYKWFAATSEQEKADIWHQLLAINADQTWSIGIIAGVMQPVVVRNDLRNVPQEGLWNWDPGAHFGLYEPDLFWFDG